MKLLFVDCALTHISPTATLMPALARAIAGDTCFYGPGFTAPETLAQGITRFIDREGPFDVLLIGPNVPLIVDDNSSAIDGALAYLRKFTAHQFALGDAALFFRDLQATIAHLPINCKIVSTLNFDYYAATGAQTEKIDAYGLHLLGPNEQFVSHLDDLPDFARQEKHFVTKQARLSDIWHDWLAAHPQRVIPALHFVASTEFDYTPLCGRPTGIAVPGAGYYLRRQAEQALKKNNLAPAGKTSYTIMRMAAKIGLPVFNTHLGLKLFNFIYCRTLAETRYVYTARGGFGIPVRKYLEIPAAGALLICVPCNGFDAMGYRDGAHYIAADPEQLPDLIAELNKTPERVQAIARAGLEQTFAAHSLGARAIQIRRCLEQTLTGHYAGARWNNGTMECAEATSCAA